MQNGFIKVFSKTILVMSLIFNALFIALLVITSFSHVSSLTFQNMDVPCTTAATVVSFPQGAGAVLGPPEITLHKGQQCTLQLSLVNNGKQANWLMQLMYNHKIVSVEPSQYGVLITALSAGETHLQTIAKGGITDTAIVTVLE
jgi:hypothetical protein